jgi:SWI/SNF-related matrix-associated actin-dependent regulator of chromatin subfamily A-like protein 1
VISLTTETGNYIAWGYCSKNCGAYHNGFGWDFSGASNLTELSQRLRSTVMIRRTKAQVLPQLPEKIRTVVELYPASAEIKRTIKQELDAYEARFLKVDHGSINWDDLARVRHQTAFAKVPLIVQYVTEVLEGGVQKIVVFAHHRDVIAQLVGGLSEYPSGDAYWRHGSARAAGLYRRFPK